MAAAAIPPFRFPTLSVFADEEWAAAAFKVGQRVRTVAGDLGRIVGFYRTANPTALIALDSGTTTEFSLKDLVAPS